MKVYLASDHTGITLKDKIFKMLLELEYDATDCGAFEYNADDDYPDLISLAAKKVSEEPHTTRGIVFGGSGQGEAMVANKFKNVRCALFYAPVVATQAIDIEGTRSTDPYEIVKLTREHNGANMLSIGFRFLKEDEVIHGIITWLEAADPTVERHLRRIEKIKKIEGTV
jgi:ribose 5-phosphate isomerase B